MKGQGRSASEIVTDKSPVTMRREKQSYPHQCIAISPHFSPKELIRRFASRYLILSNTRERVTRHFQLTPQAIENKNFHLEIPLRLPAIFHESSSPWAAAVITAWVRLSAGSF